MVATLLSLFQVWESVGDLERLPVFIGLKQSVAEHSHQWQEYFNVRNRVLLTVVNPCIVERFFCFFFSCFVFCCCSLLFFCFVALVIIFWRFVFWTKIWHQISNGNRNGWSSNSVCNHTSDWQSWTTAKWESDLLITRMIADGIKLNRVLLTINQDLI